jgi:hypothetical protein
VFPIYRRSQYIGVANTLAFTIHMHSEYTSAPDAHTFPKNMFPHEETYIDLEILMDATTFTYDEA